MEKLERIQKKFTVLKDEALKDCTFDKQNMKGQFDNTYVTMKWINRKSEWNEIYRVFEFKRKEMYRKLYEFYKLESSLKINTKDELSLFIESDTQYYELLSVTQTVKEVIQYIESVVETLKAKNFEIGRYLDYTKFIHGK